MIIRLICNYFKFLYCFLSIYIVFSVRFNVVDHINEEIIIPLKSQYDLEPGTLLQLPIDIPQQYLGLYGEKTPRLKSITSSNSDGVYSIGDIILIHLVFTQPIYIIGIPKLTLNTGCHSASCTTKEIQMFTCYSDDGMFAVKLDNQFIMNIDVNTTAGEFKNRLELLNGIHQVTVSFGTSGDTSYSGGNRICTSKGKNVTIAFDNVTFPQYNGNISPLEFDITNEYPNPRTELSQGLLLSSLKGQHRNYIPMITNSTIQDGYQKTDGIAYYIQGNGTDTITFEWIVESGDAVTILEVNSIQYDQGYMYYNNTGTIISPSVPYFGACSRYMSPVPSSLGCNVSISVSSTQPIITSVTSPNKDGTYTVGDRIVIQVLFDLPIKIYAPHDITLLLNTGVLDRSAVFNRFIENKVIEFIYTVQSNDSSTSLDYKSTESLNIGKNGKIYRNALGNSTIAILTLPIPSSIGSLSYGRSIIIDTTSPYILSIAILSSPGIIYTAGDVLDIEVTYTFPVTVIGSPILWLRIHPRLLHATIRNVPALPSYSFTNAKPGHDVQIILHFQLNWKLLPGDEIRIYLPNGFHRNDYENKLEFQSQIESSPIYQNLSLRGISKNDYIGYYSNHTISLIRQNTSQDISLYENNSIHLIISSNNGIYSPTFGLIGSITNISYQIMSSSPLIKGKMTTYKFDGVTSIGFNNLSLEISPAIHDYITNIILSYQTPELLAIGDSFIITFYNFSSSISSNFVYLSNTFTLNWSYVTSDVLSDTISFTIMNSDDDDDDDDSSSCSKKQYFTQAIQVTYGTLKLQVVDNITNLSHQLNISSYLDVMIPSGGVTSSSVSVTLRSETNGNMDDLSIPFLSNICGFTTLYVEYVTKLPSSISAVDVVMMISHTLHKGDVISVLLPENSGSNSSSSNNEDKMVISKDWCFGTDCDLFDMVKYDNKITFTVISTTTTVLSSSIPSSYRICLRISSSAGFVVPSNGVLPGISYVRGYIQSQACTMLSYQKVYLYSGVIVPVNSPKIQFLSSSNQSYNILGQNVNLVLSFGISYSLSRHDEIILTLPNGFDYQNNYTDIIFDVESNVSIHNTSNTLPVFSISTEYNRQNLPNVIFTLLEDLQLSNRTEITSSNHSLVTISISIPLSAGLLASDLSIPINGCLLSIQSFSTNYKKYIPILSNQIVSSSCYGICYSTISYSTVFDRESLSIVATLSYSEILYNGSYDIVLSVPKFIVLSNLSYPNIPANIVIPSYHFTSNISYCKAYQVGYHTLGTDGIGYSSLEEDNNEEIHDYYITDQIVLHIPCDMEAFTEFTIEISNLAFPNTSIDKLDIKLTIHSYGDLRNSSLSYPITSSVLFSLPNPIYATIKFPTAELHILSNYVSETKTYDVNDLNNTHVIIFNATVESYVPSSTILYLSLPYFRIDTTKYAILSNSFYTSTNINISQVYWTYSGSNEENSILSFSIPIDSGLIPGSMLSIGIEGIIYPMQLSSSSSFADDITIDTDGYGYAIGYRISDGMGGNGMKTILPSIHPFSYVDTIYYISNSLLDVKLSSYATITTTIFTATNYSYQNISDGSFRVSNFTLSYTVNHIIESGDLFQYTLPCFIIFSNLTDTSDSNNNDDNNNDNNNITIPIYFTGTFGTINSIASWNSMTSTLSYEVPSLSYELSAGVYSIFIDKDRDLAYLLSNYSIFYHQTNTTYGRILWIRSFTTSLTETIVTIPCIGICNVTITPTIAKAGSVMAYNLSILFNHVDFIESDIIRLHLPSFYSIATEPVAYNNSSRVQLLWNSSDSTLLITGMSNFIPTEVINTIIPLSLKISTPKNGIRSKPYPSDYSLGSIDWISSHRQIKSIGLRNILSIRSIGKFESISFILSDQIPNKNVALHIQFRLQDRLEVNDKLQFYLTGFTVSSSSSSSSSPFVLFYSLDSMEPIGYEKNNITEIYLNETYSSATLSVSGLNDYTQEVINPDNTYSLTHHISKLFINILKPINALELISLIIPSSYGILTPSTGIYGVTVPKVNIISTTTPIDTLSIYNYTSIGSLHPLQIQYEYYNSGNNRYKQSIQAIVLNFTINCPLLSNDLIFIQIPSIDIDINANVTSNSTNITRKDIYFIENITVEYSRYDIKFRNSYWNISNHVLILSIYSINSTLLSGLVRLSITFDRDIAFISNTTIIQSNLSDYTYSILSSSLCPVQSAPIDSFPEKKIFLQLIDMDENSITSQPSTSPTEIFIPMVISSSISFLSSDVSNQYVSGGDKHVIALQPGHEFNEQDIGSIISIHDHLYTIQTIDLENSLLYLTKPYLGHDIILGEPSVSIYSSSVRPAEYKSGSTTNKLLFQYLVRRGDLSNGITIQNISDPNGQYIGSMIDINNGHIYRTSMAASLTVRLSFSSLYLSTFTSYIINTDTPFITNVYTTTKPGTYTLLDQIDFHIQFSYPLVSYSSTKDSNGTDPILLLHISPYGLVIANYSSGLGSNTVVFVYTIKSDDDQMYRRSDLLDATNQLNSTYYQPLRIIAYNKLTYLRRNALYPILDADVTFQKNMSLSIPYNISIIGDAPYIISKSIANPNKIYTLGDVIDIYITYSDAILFNKTIGIPYLTIVTREDSNDDNSNSNIVTSKAYYIGMKGNNTLVFQYEITIIDNFPMGLLLSCQCEDYFQRTYLNLSDSEIVSYSNQNIKASLVLAKNSSEMELLIDSRFQFDRTPPSITSISSNLTYTSSLSSSLSSSESYGIGTSILITLTFSSPLYIQGLPYLTLLGSPSPSVAYYYSGNQTNTMVFLYQVTSESGVSRLDTTGIDALYLHNQDQILRLSDHPMLSANRVVPARGTSSSLGIVTDIIIDTSTTKIMSVIPHVPINQVILSTPYLEFSIKVFDQLDMSDVNDREYRDHSILPVYENHTLNTYFNHFIDNEINVNDPISRIYVSISSIRNNYYNVLFSKSNPLSILSIPSIYLSENPLIPIEVVQPFWWNSYSIQSHLLFDIVFDRNISSQGLQLELNTGKFLRKAYASDIASNKIILVIKIDQTKLSSPYSIDSQLEYFQISYGGYTTRCISITASTVGPDSILEAINEISSLQRLGPFVYFISSDIITNSRQYQIIFNRKLSHKLTIVNGEGVCLYRISSHQVYFTSSNTISFQYPIRYGNMILFKANNTIPKGSYKISIPFYEGIGINRFGIAKNSIQFEYFNSDGKVLSTEYISMAGIRGIVSSSLGFDTSIPSSRTSIFITICLTEKWNVGDVLSIYLKGFECENSYPYVGNQSIIFYHQIDHILTFNVTNPVEYCLSETIISSQSDNNNNNSSNFILFLPSYGIYQGNYRSLFNFNISSSSNDNIISYKKIVFDSVSFTGINNIKINISNPVPSQVSPIIITFELLSPLYPNDSIIIIYLPGFSRYPSNHFYTYLYISGPYSKHFQANWMNSSYDINSNTNLVGIELYPLSILESGIEYSVTIDSLPDSAILISDYGLSEINPPAIAIRSSNWKLSRTDIYDYPKILGLSYSQLNLSYSIGYNISQLTYSVNFTRALVGPVTISLTLPFLSTPFYSDIFIWNLSESISIVWQQYNHMLSFISQTGYNNSLLRFDISNFPSDFYINSKGIPKSSYIDNGDRVSVITGSDSFLLPTSIRYITPIGTILSSSIEFSTLSHLTDVFSIDPTEIKINLVLNMPCNGLDIFEIKFRGVYRIHSNSSTMIVIGNCVYNSSQIQYYNESDISYTILSIIYSNTTACETTNNTILSWTIPTSAMFSSPNTISQYDSKAFEILWKSKDFNTGYQCFTNYPTIGFLSSYIQYGTPTANSISNMTIRLVLSNILQSGDGIVLYLSKVTYPFSTTTIIDQYGIDWNIITNRSSYSITFLSTQIIHPRVIEFILNGSKSITLPNTSTIQFSYSNNSFLNKLSIIRGNRELIAETISRITMIGGITSIRIQAIPTRHNILNLPNMQRYITFTISLSLLHSLTIGDQIILYAPDYDFKFDSYLFCNSESNFIIQTNSISKLIMITVMISDISIINLRIYPSPALVIDFLKCGGANYQCITTISILSQSNPISSYNYVPECTDFLIYSSIDFTVQDYLLTYSPTSMPSSQPSSQPSSKPSSQPTFIPSSYPTNYTSYHHRRRLSGTSTPTFMPSSQPTSFPSRQPTSQPSSKPSSSPSSIPSNKPTSYYLFIKLIFQFSTILVKGSSLRVILPPLSSNYSDVSDIIISQSNLPSNVKDSLVITWIEVNHTLLLTTHVTIIPNNYYVSIGSSQLYLSNGIMYENDSSLSYDIYDNQFNCTIVEGNFNYVEANGLKDSYLSFSNPINNDITSIHLSFRSASSSFYINDRVNVYLPDFLGENLIQLNISGIGSESIKGYWSDVQHALLFTITQKISHIAIMIDESNMLRIGSDGLNNSTSYPTISLRTQNFRYFRPTRFKSYQPIAFFRKSIFNISSPVQSGQEVDINIHLDYYSGVGLLPYDTFTIILPKFWSSREIISNTNLVSNRVETFDLFWHSSNSSLKIQSKESIVGSSLELDFTISGLRLPYDGLSPELSKYILISTNATNGIIPNVIFQSISYVTSLLHSSMKFYSITPNLTLYDNLTMEIEFQLSSTLYPNDTIILYIPGVTIDSLNYVMIGYSRIIEEDSNTNSYNSISLNSNNVTISWEPTENKLIVLIWDTIPAYSLITIVSINDTYIQLSSRGFPLLSESSNLMLPTISVYGKDGSMDSIPIESYPTLGFHHAHIYYEYIDIFQPLNIRFEFQLSGGDINIGDYLVLSIPILIQNISNSTDVVDPVDRYINVSVQGDYAGDNFKSPFNVSYNNNDHKFQFIANSIVLSNRIINLFIGYENKFQFNISQTNLFEDRNISHKLFAFIESLGGYLSYGSNVLYSPTDFGLLFPTPSSTELYITECSLHPHIIGCNIEFEITLLEDMKSDYMFGVSSIGFDYKHSTHPNHMITIDGNLSSYIHSYYRLADNMNSVQISSSTLSYSSIENDSSYAYTDANADILVQTANLTIPNYIQNQASIGNIITTVPKIISIQSNSVIKSLVCDDYVYISLLFTEPVMILQPQVTKLYLNTLEYANYYSGNMTNTIIFLYRVTIHSLSTSNLQVFGSNALIYSSVTASIYRYDSHGGSSDSILIPANLTLPMPYGKLIRYNGFYESISISCNNTAVVTTIEIYNHPNRNKLYPGDNIDIAIVFNRLVQVYGLPYLILKTFSENNNNTSNSNSDLYDDSIVSKAIVYYTNVSKIQYIDILPYYNSYNETLTESLGQFVIVYDNEISTCINWNDRTGLLKAIENLSTLTYSLPLKIETYAVANGIGYKLSFSGPISPHIIVIESLKCTYDISYSLVTIDPNILDKVIFRYTIPTATVTGGGSNSNNNDNHNNIKVSKGLSIYDSKALHTDKYNYIYITGHVLLPPQVSNILPNMSIVYDNLLNNLTNSSSSNSNNNYGNGVNSSNSQTIISYDSPYVLRVYSNFTDTLGKKIANTGDIVVIIIEFSDPIQLNGTAIITLDISPIDRTTILTENHTVSSNSNSTVAENNLFKYNSRSATSTHSINNKLYLSYIVQSGDYAFPLNYLSSKSLSLLNNSQLYLNPSNYAVSINNRLQANLILPNPQSNNSLASSNIEINGYPHPVLSNITGISGIYGKAYVNSKSIIINLLFSNTVYFLASNSTSDSTNLYIELISYDSVDKLLFQYLYGSGTNVLSFAYLSSTLSNQGNVDYILNFTLISYPIEILSIYSSFYDSLGNILTNLSYSNVLPSIVIDTYPTKVMYVDSLNSDGIYYPGQIINIFIQFSKPVAILLQSYDDENDNYNGDNGFSSDTSSETSILKEFRIVSDTVEPMIELFVSSSLHTKQLAKYVYGNMTDQIHFEYVIPISENNHPFIRLDYSGVLALESYLSTYDIQFVEYYGINNIMPDSFANNSGSSTNINISNYSNGSNNIPINTTLPSADESYLFFFRNIFISFTQLHVLQIYSNASESIYTLGDSIYLFIEFSQAVTTFFPPVLRLNTAGIANHSAIYITGNNSNLFVYMYTIQPQDNAHYLDYVDTRYNPYDMQNYDKSFALSTDILIGTDGRLPIRINTSHDRSDDIILYPSIFGGIYTFQTLDSNNGSSSVSTTTTTTINSYYSLPSSNICNLSYTLAYSLSDNTYQSLSYRIANSLSDSILSDSNHNDHLVSTLLYSSSPVYCQSYSLSYRRPVVPINMALPIPGSPGSLSYVSHITIDTSTPYVLRVYSTTSSGTFGGNIGNTAVNDDSSNDNNDNLSTNTSQNNSSSLSIIVAVEFSAPVVVKGCPRILFIISNNKRYANYVNGSNTSILYFRFVIRRNDYIQSFDYYDRNSLELYPCNAIGYTIDYTMSNILYIRRKAMIPTIDANLTLPTLGPPLTITSGTSITGSGSNITISNIAYIRSIFTNNNNRTYCIGDVINIYLTYSQNISLHNNLQDNVILQLSDNISQLYPILSNTITASEGSSLFFPYTIQYNDKSSSLSYDGPYAFTSLFSNSCPILLSESNYLCAPMTLPYPNTNPSIDQFSPKNLIISSVLENTPIINYATFIRLENWLSQNQYQYQNQNPTYSIGENIEFIVSFSQPILVIGKPSILFHYETSNEQIRLYYKTTLTPNTMLFSQYLNSSYPIGRLLCSYNTKVTLSNGMILRYANFLPILSAELDRLGHICDPTINFVEYYGISSSSNQSNDNATDSLYNSFSTVVYANIVSNIPYVINVYSNHPAVYSISDPILIYIQFSCPIQVIVSNQSIGLELDLLNFPMAYYIYQQDSYTLCFEYIVSSGEIGTASLDYTSTNALKVLYKNAIDSIDSMNGIYGLYADSTASTSSSSSSSSHRLNLISANLTLPKRGSKGSLGRSGDIRIDPAQIKITNIASYPMNVTIGDILSIVIAFTDKVILYNPTSSSSLQNNDVDCLSLNISIKSSNGIVYYRQAYIFFDNNMKQYSSSTISSVDSIIFTYKVTADDPIGYIYLSNTSPILYSSSNICQIVSANSYVPVSTYITEKNFNHVLSYIDLMVPYVLSVYANNVTSTTNMNINTNTKTSYTIGDAIDIYIIFSDPIAVLSIPTLRMRLTNGISYAMYVGPNPSDQSVGTILPFRYTIPSNAYANPLDYDGIHALVGDIRRYSIHPTVSANLTLPIPSYPGSLSYCCMIDIDTDTAYITSIIPLKEQGIYGANEIILILVRFSKPIVVFGSPILSLVTGWKSTDDIGNQTVISYAIYIESLDVLPTLGEEIPNDILIDILSTDILFLYKVKVEDNILSLRHSDENALILPNNASIVSNNIPVNTILRNPNDFSTDSNGNLNGQWKYRYPMNIEIYIKDIYHSHPETININLLHLSAKNSILKGNSIAANANPNPNAQAKTFGMAYPNSNLRLSTSKSFTLDHTDYKVKDNNIQVYDKDTAIGYSYLFSDIVAENIAVYGIATQSSTIRSAYLAIDSNTNARIDQDSVTETYPMKEPYWQLQLSPNTSVYSIVIYPRLPELWIPTVIDYTIKGLDKYPIGTYKLRISNYNIQNSTAYVISSSISYSATALEVQSILSNLSVIGTVYVNRTTLPVCGVYNINGCGDGVEYGYGYTYEVTFETIYLSTITIDIVDKTFAGGLVVNGANEESSNVFTSALVTHVNIIRYGYYISTPITPSYPKNEVIYGNLSSGISSGEGAGSNLWLTPYYVMLFDTIPPVALNDSIAKSVWHHRYDTIDNVQNIKLPKAYSITYLKIQREGYESLSLAEVEIYSEAINTIGTYNYGSPIVPSSLTNPYQPEESFMNVYSNLFYDGRWILEITQSNSIESNSSDTIASYGIISEYSIVVTDICGTVRTYHQDLYAEIESLPKYGTLTETIPYTPHPYGELETTI